MLDVKDINAAYGQVKVLNGVSLNVDAGEILCVMGRNGAGKTTLLKTIMGIVRATSGSITLDDQELTKLENHQIPKMGIGYIPQGRRLFPELTVTITAGPSYYSIYLSILSHFTNTLISSIFNFVFKTT